MWDLNFFQIRPWHLLAHAWILDLDSAWVHNDRKTNIPITALAGSPDSPLPLFPFYIALDPGFCAVPSYYTLLKRKSNIGIRKFMSVEFKFVFFNTKRVLSVF